MKKTIGIKVQCSKDNPPASGKPQALYALVDLVPEGVNGHRAPASFCMVLDRSGSMEGAKMENLKKAVREALSRMDEKDRLSIVMFDDEIEVLVPSQPVKDPGEFAAKVEKIIPRGGTQIASALKKGLEEAAKSDGSGLVSHLLLLTDGQTWGDEDECRKAAREAGGRGTSIITAGIGEEWNEKLLLEISDLSHGSSHFIQKPEEIVSCLQEEVTGMRSVLASSAEAVLKLSPGVTLLHAHRTQPMISDLGTVQGRVTYTLPLGEITGPRGQALLFELQVPARDAGSFRVGQVEVSYHSDGRVTEKADIQVEFSADTALSARVNPRVMNLVEKISAFKLQTRALKEAELGNVISATKKLEAAATRLLDMGETDLAETARREAKTLTATGKMTGMGTKKLVYGTRKLTQRLEQEK